MCGGMRAPGADGSAAGRGSPVAARLSRGRLRRGSPLPPSDRTVGAPPSAFSVSGSPERPALGERWGARRAFNSPHPASLLAFIPAGERAERDDPGRSGRRPPTPGSPPRTPCQAGPERRTPNPHGEGRWGDAARPPPPPRHGFRIPAGGRWRRSQVRGVRAGRRRTGSPRRG